MLTEGESGKKWGEVGWGEVGRRGENFWEGGGEFVGIGKSGRIGGELKELREM